MQMETRMSEPIPPPGTGNLWMSCSRMTSRSLWNAVRPPVDQVRSHDGERRHERCPPTRCYRPAIVFLTLLCRGSAGDACRLIQSEPDLSRHPHGTRHRPGAPSPEQRRDSGPPEADPEWADPLLGEACRARVIATSTA